MDVDVNDGTAAGQSMPNAAPPGNLFLPATPSAAGTPARRGNPLFLPATPSAAGTPARQRYSNVPS